MLIYVVLSWVLIRADDSGVHEINDIDDNDGNDDNDNNDDNDDNDDNDSNDDNDGQSASDLERYFGSLLDQRWCLKKFDGTKVILMLSWCWSWCWS